MNCGLRREDGPDLTILDPGSEDRGYWRRFENRVLTAALPALARRRRAARTTLPDVVSAWSRLVVPTATAAALAGVAFLTAPGQDDVGGAPAALEVRVGEVVEEAVLPGEEGFGIMPQFLASEETVDHDVVHFAIEES